MFSLVSRKFLAMRNITLYSVFETVEQVEITLATVNLARASSLYFIVYYLAQDI